MIWQRARFFLLAVVVVCSTGLSARADCCNTDCAPACAPAYRTVTVTEYKPTTVEEVRTVYKTVCDTEKYTAYRTECVPETRHRTVCCTKLVPTVEDPHLHRVAQRSDGRGAGHHQARRGLQARDDLRDQDEGLRPLRVP